MVSVAATDILWGEVVVKSSLPSATSEAWSTLQAWMTKWPLHISEWTLPTPEYSFQITCLTKLKIPQQSTKENTNISLPSNKGWQKNVFSQFKTRERPFLSQYIFSQYPLRWFLCSLHINIQTHIKYK